MSSYITKLFRHEVPLWHLPLAFLGVHALLYVYWAYFNSSLIALLSFVLILILTFRLFRPIQPSTSDWLSDEACKSIYQILYVSLNRAATYFRSAVMLKGGFKAVAKAVAFLYLSIAFKFLGDRLAIYLCKISIFTNNL